MRSSWVAEMRAALLLLLIGSADGYDFIWKAGSGGGQGSFLETLAREAGPNDFHYVLTGDTQFWFPCTKENGPCQDATGHCGYSGSVDGGHDDESLSISDDCVEAQGRWSNGVQQLSWQHLFDAMTTYGIRPKGMIINGDLTAYGHPGQWALLNARFGDRAFLGVPLYPGLGNHDYQNNIDHCSPANSCPDLMLTWMEDYATMKIRRPVDLRVEHTSLFKTIRTGSLSYSWDSCSGSNCVHFAQLQNFPSYSVNFTAWPGLHTWRVAPSLDWLAGDLAPYAGKAVVINYHDYDNYQSGADRKAFIDVLEKSKAKVLGIFFAHYHWAVGLHPRTSHLCIGGRPVPLVYSGSVPGNNYVVARLSGGSIGSLYAVNVPSNASSTAWPIHLPTQC